jgi:hypothetical protein
MREVWYLFIVCRVQHEAMEGGSIVYSRGGQLQSAGATLLWGDTQETYFFDDLFLFR